MQKMEKKICSNFGNSQKITFMFNIRRLSEKEEKTERKKRTVRFQLQEGRGRKFNHAPRAGKELTAGGARSHTSMADATGNAPSAISSVGSRAVAIELCRATERRLRHSFLEFVAKSGQKFIKNLQKKVQNLTRKMKLYILVSECSR